jgi:Na+-translocating ferredoxin:NAD+ oxidoreductase RnfD subunit
MLRPEKVLVTLLRMGAVITLSALGAVVMPQTWMAAIHQALGMGDLPDLPIVGYLTRSLSALYAVHGAMLLFVSFDVRRYLPLVRFSAGLVIVFGAMLLAIDAAAGLPWWWTFVEGPFLVVLGTVLLGLSGRIPQGSSQ